MKKKLGRTGFLVILREELRPMQRSIQWLRWPRRTNWMLKSIWLSCWRSVPMRGWLTMSWRSWFPGVMKPAHFVALHSKLLSYDNWLKPTLASPERCKRFMIQKCSPCLAKALTLCDLFRLPVWTWFWTYDSPPKIICKIMFSSGEKPHGHRHEKSPETVVFQGISAGNRTWSVRERYPRL